VVLYDLVNDLAESKDVSAENPEIVQILKAQIDVEAKKIGAAYSHLPLNIQPAQPAPRGSVLAVDLEMKSPADLTKQTLYLFNRSFDVLPEYYLEYDIKVDFKSDLSYCYLSPLRLEKPVFEGGIGVDLTGKLVQSPTTFDNNWKHVAVGLCSFSPKKFGQFGLTFKFNSVKRTTVYLDNILIKNMKGEVLQEIFVDQLPNNSIKSTNMSIVAL
jgi:hypothetical protein